MLRTFAVNQFKSVVYSDADFAQIWFQIFVGGFLENCVAAQIAFRSIRYQAKLRTRLAVNFVVRFEQSRTRCSLISTQNDLDQLAGRIERAYRRRHPLWTATGLTPGVWTAAAVRLSEVAMGDSILPIDAELFIAVQNYKSFRRDPWGELTQERATKSYRLAIRVIIKQLKKEIAAELKWSQRVLEMGRSLDEVLTSTKSRVSPITKLVLCHREGREDLAQVVRPAAEAQHLACPLYRYALKNLIAHAAYPEPRNEVIKSRDVIAQNRSFAWN